MTKIQKVKIVVMTLLLCCLVVSMNFILCRQPNSQSDAVRVKNFYKLEKNSLDMAMIGASTVYTNYSAPLAWKEYGYTSYSLGTNMAPMGIAKSMLQEVMRTQNPKLIVIDINGILYNDEQESREGAKRLWIDNMPDSKNKRDTIQELVPEDERLAYYIPFLKYHSNWKNLDQCFRATMDELTDHDDVHLAARGMQGSTRIAPQRDFVDIKKYNDKLPMHKLSGQHLQELLEYCQNEKITNVIFTNMPRYYSKKMLPERKRNNTAKELIRQYGFECLDMDDYVDEIGLDPGKDFYNENHLNIHGQKKLTKYLGGLLNERFQLSQRDHDESIKKRYDQEFIAYEKVYQWVDSQMKHKKARRYNYDKVREIIEN